MISVWQDIQKRTETIKKVDEGKAQSKARKDSLYRSVPSDRGGRSGGKPRQMSDDEFNRLPAEEKRKLWRMAQQ